MSTFFFRRSVEKAFQLDEYPTSLSLSPFKPLNASPPFIILAVDDVIFIVNSIIQKSLSTSQKDIIAHVVPTIGRVMESDFVGMIQRKMRDETYPKALTSGGLPPEDVIIQFIVLINSLDVANDYLTRIISSNLGVHPQLDQGLTADSPIRNSFHHAASQAFVSKALTNLLTSFTHKTSELLNDGFIALVSNVIKPRLRPVLNELFRDMDYSLSEEDAEPQDDALVDSSNPHALLAARFENGWDVLMQPISRIMTPKPFAAVLDMTAKYLATHFERRIWSYAGKCSAFGGLRMERDFGGLIGVVAKGGSGSGDGGGLNYSVREVFVRVSQILMVANMEDDEWEEVQKQGAGEDGDDTDDVGILWVLTEDEKRNARRFIR